VVAGRLGATRAVTTAADRDRCGYLLVLRYRSIEDGELERLQAKKALADRGIGVRVELAALQVPKEFVQRIIASLAIVGMVSILALAQRIVHITVGMWVCSLGRRVWLIVLGGGVGVLPIDAIDGTLKVMSGSGIPLRVLREHHIRMFHARFGGTNLGVIGMGFDMLLQILGALESLAAEITLVRLERYMHPDVGSDVVPFDRGGVAGTPLASEVQVVSTLTANVAFANMLLVGGLVGFLTTYTTI
jgi:hypothetical protein